MSDRMPCMAVKQPWASLLVSGIKDVENRNRAMPEQLRGRWCAIYASKTLAWVPGWISALLRCSPDYAATGRIPSPDLPASHWPWTSDVKAARKQCTRGAIVGLVKWAGSAPPKVNRLESPWAEPGANHWTYSDRIVLPEPVPLPDGGFQGLYWYLGEETRWQVVKAAKVAGHFVATDAHLALLDDEREPLTDITGCDV